MLQVLSLVADLATNRNNRRDFMAQTVTLWGALDKTGTITNGSGGFTVARTDTGRYSISFTTVFQGLPSIVGSPTNHGDLNQNTKDNVVFPQVTDSAALAFTGDENGNKKDRSFSFIAIGLTA